jgi:hypothetical protein
MVNGDAFESHEGSPRHPLKRGAGVEIVHYVQTSTSLPDSPGARSHVPYACRQGLGLTRSGRNREPPGLHEGHSLSTTRGGSFGFSGFQRGEMVSERHHLRERRPGLLRSAHRAVPSGRRVHDQALR